MGLWSYVRLSALVSVLSATALWQSGNLPGIVDGENGVARAASPTGPALDLPAPVLLTNSGGRYTEPVGDLDLLLPNFTRPADQPAPPGDEFSPQLTGAARPGRPVMTSYTRQADPDRTVVLSGAGLTSRSGADALTDTELILYTQSTPSNGTQVRMPLLRGNATSLAGVVPAGVSYGMYLVWATNASGASYPVRVNATEAWWLGPNHAQAGQPASVYGRNLSHQNKTATSYVYLRPWGAGAEAASTPAKVTEVNPYKVTFLLPANLSGGQNYEVWIHNGHGGEYGWSGPLKLTVDQGERYRWDGKTISVTSHGATPNDSSDDSAAIQAAFNAASNGDRVMFPAGRYIVRKRIEVDKAVSMEGVAEATSVIEAPMTNLQDSSIFIVRAYPSRVRNLGFVNQVTSGLYQFGGTIFFDGKDIRPSPSGIVVENARFTTAAGAPQTTIGVREVNDVHITGSTFTGGSGMEINNAYQVFVKGNTFLGNWPDVLYSDQSAVGERASSEMEVSGNTARSINRAQRQTMTRFWVGQGHGHGLTSNVYIAENRTEGLGCGTDVCGEQVMFESPGAFHTGPPAAIAGDTLSFSGVNWTPGFFADDDRTISTPYQLQRAAIVAIQAGTGAGQYRRILSNTTNQIRVDRPWEIAPDMTSVLTILTGAFNAVVYKNDLNGFPEALANKHLQNGGVFSAYGSQMDTVVADNTVSQTAVGIETTALVNQSCAATLNGQKIEGASALSNCPNWGVHITGNTVRQTLYGIVSWTRVSGNRSAGPGPLMTANIIRDNRVENSEVAGISVGDINNWPQDLNWQRDAVVEFNEVVDSQIALDLGGLAADTIVRGNRFSRGQRAGASGVRFHNLNRTPYLFGNQFEGSPNPLFSGNVPGPVLVADAHRIVLGSPGYREVVNLHNAGTAPLTVGVDGAPSWLNVSLDRSGLSDQSLTAHLELRLVPGSLNPGTHAATLRLSAPGLPNQNLEVVVNVDEGEPLDPDTQAPQVEFSGITPGQQWLGTATVNVNATDDRGVAGVTLLVDGVQYGAERTAQPYQFALDTLAFPNGEHILLARARDTSGNTAETAPVTVRVLNPPTFERSFVTNNTLGRLRQDYQGWLGMQFRVGNEPLTITSLGRSVIEGNRSPLILKLVDGNTGLDVPGGSVVLPPPTMGSGTYTYAPLNQPVTLPAGVVFYLVSEQNFGRDYFYHSNTAVQTHAEATVEGAIYWSNGNKRWVLEGAMNNSFVPVDFRYRAATATRRR